MTKRKSTPVSDGEEASIQEQIATDPEDADATDEELAKARPFADAFPHLMESIRRSRGRPRLDDAKQAVTLRLKPSTLAKFKATGKNWRARMVDALEKARVR